MMLSLEELVRKHRMEITGILHCGARIGEEAGQYQAVGVGNVWWVEANERVIPKLRETVEPLGHHVIEALLYDVDGAHVEFHVTNYDGLSSSVLEFGTHTSFSPDVVFERHDTLESFTVDTLVGRHQITGCNMLVMDLQGAEMFCLRGASRFLAGVDYVFTEVNNAEVYRGCARVEQLDAFLEGFERVDTYWVGDQGWGDALYVRRQRVTGRVGADVNINVIVPSYNVRMPWIERCLASIRAQTHRPSQVIVVDDASTDAGYPENVVGLCAIEGWTFVRNDRNRKCPYNLRLAGRILDLADDDVIFLLDGDDFLPHDRVFARIAEVYADPDVWLTYGNYEPHPKNTGQTLASAYPADVIAAKSFRAAGCHFNHPLTFRQHLWARVTDDDLKTDGGEWFTGGYDFLIMVPMLEAAAPDHFRFLNETLYVYNSVNPLSDSTANVPLVEESRQIVARPARIYQR